jgi:hypothetical protein
MTQQNFHCSITADVTAPEAFNNICHVSEWWTKSYVGSSQKTGDTFSVRFGETVVSFEIIEVVPDKKIVWQVTDCYLHWLKDKKEWKGTKLLWEISNENNMTQVSMTHIGLVPQIECYQNCEEGWNFFVTESLFKLLTEHKGMPDRQKH